MKNKRKLAIVVILDIFIVFLIIYALRVQNYVEFGKASEQTISIAPGQSVTIAFQGNARDVTGITFCYRTKENVFANVVVKDADGTSEYYDGQVLFMGDDTCTIQFDRKQQSKKEAYAVISVLDDSKADLELVLSQSAGCQVMYKDQWLVDQSIFVKLHTSDYDRLAVLLLMMGMAGNLIVLLVHKSKDEERLGRILSVIYIAIIFMLSLWNLNELRGPIGGDQPGYWGHALNLSGRFGKYMMPNWFAAGYSIVLSIMMRVTASSYVVYHMAIILNAFLGMGMFFVLNKLIRRLKEIPLPLSVTIAFFISCYSAHLFQIGIVWPETFLYCLFLCIILVFMHIVDAANTRNVLVFGILCVYLYWLHNRTIVVLIAALLATFFLYGKKHIRKYHLAEVVSIIVIGYLGAQIFKEYTSVLMWNEINAFAKNSITSVLENLFSTGNLILLFYSLCGKIWYFLSATYGLAGIGIIFWIVSLCKMFKQNDKKMSVYLFVVLCFLGVLAVAVLSALPRTEPDAHGFRLDSIIYGRYLEVATGILLAGAGMYLYEIRNRILATRVFGMVLFVYLFSLGGIFAYWRQYKIQDIYVTVPCIPGVYFDSEFSFVRYSLGVLLVFSFIYIGKLVLMQNEELKKENLKKITAGTVALVCLFLRTAYVGNVDYTMNFTRGWNDYDELIDFCDRCNDISIYMEKSIGDNIFWQMGMKAMNTKCLKYEVRNDRKDGMPDLEFLYEQPIDDQYLLFRNMNKPEDGSAVYEGYYYLGTFNHDAIGIYTKSKEIADWAGSLAYEWLQEKSLVMCVSNICVSVNESVVDHFAEDKEVVDETGRRVGEVRQIIWDPAKNVNSKRYSVFVQIELDSHVVLTDTCTYYINEEKCDGAVGEDGILTITKDITINTQ